MAILTLLTLGGVGAIAIPIRYCIAERDLLIQSGVWTIRIPLLDIQRVSPSRSLLSSPALSMDRLAIQYRRSQFSRPEILISPARQGQFLRELGAAAGLESGKGDVWVRADANI